MSTKQLYSVSELVEMGYPKDWLHRLARSSRGDYYAAKMGAAKNSKLLFRLDRLQAGMESGAVQRILGRGE